MLAITLCSSGRSAAFAAFAAFSTVGASGPLSAQSSISVTSPSTLTISSATAGSQPNSHTQTAQYSVTVAGTRMKITGYADTPLPAGVTLTISLVAPSGAVSLGTVTLTTSAQDLVRYIPAGTYTSLTVTYTLSATVSAGVVSSNSNHVVLTLADDP